MSTETTTRPQWLGTSDAGVRVFVTSDYLARCRPGDAYRHADQTANRVHEHYGKVRTVLLTSYGPREFGPSGDYWTDADIVGWFSHPGGMRHGGFHNVTPGVGPQPDPTRPEPTA